MFLSRTYATRPEIPKGTEELYHKQGTLFILTGARRDFNADNPWEADNWNLSAQGRFIVEHGMRLAVAFAKAAGTTVGATNTPPKPDPIKVLIQKRVTNIGGGGGGGDSGSSGEGPPS